MFLPEKLKDAFDVAIISGEEGDRPLISSQKVYNENNKEKEAKEKGFFDVFTPRLFFWLIFGIVLVITSFELLRFKTFAVVDFIIFLCCGLAGCVIWFLNFFSEHPTVDGNLNCLWLRPLYVVVAILVWVKVAKKVLFYYHFINFVLITLLLLCMWVLPQTFNPAFIPIILTIILRSGINVKTIKPYRRKEIRRYR